MPRNTTVLPTVSGRRQADRPPLKASAPVDAERALPGALSVPIEQIVPDPDQPRRAMDSGRLAELAASLKEHGVLQPLLVREDGYLEDGRTRYMIIAGGRRHAAAQQAGLTRLPLVVRDSEGATRRLTQLAENIQRQELAPLDEALAFQELMDAEGLTAEELGKRLHITGQHVRDRILLLTDEVVALAVQRQQISPTVARDVLRLPNESRAHLRARIDAGEAVAKSDVTRARAHDAAGGVINPRAKGGGRASRKAAAPTPAPANTMRLPAEPPAPRTMPAVDQTPFDPAPSQRVHILYSAFQEWRTRVNGEINSMPDDERDMLARLLRADMAQVLQSLDEDRSTASA